MQKCGIPGDAFRFGLQRRARCVPKASNFSGRLSLGANVPGMRDTSLLLAGMLRLHALSLAFRVKVPNCSRLGGGWEYLAENSQSSRIESQIDPRIDPLDYRSPRPQRIHRSRSPSTERGRTRTTSAFRVPPSLASRVLARVLAGHAVKLIKIAAERAAQSTLNYFAKNLSLAVQRDAFAVPKIHAPRYTVVYSRESTETLMVFAAMIREGKLLLRTY